jgi:fatty-acyl-CoA synthase
MRGIGLVIAGICELGPDDVGYLSMPIFHGSGMFQNWLPAFSAGASVALREKFSASRFIDDVERYGATYWNYVGQPVHYVLAALERQYGGDEERILREVRDNPKNRMRLCVGSGASATERQTLTRYLGLEHVYEMYGSTEAEITTMCLPGHPMGSVGELNDDNVQVVDDAEHPCPPAEFDADGRIRNPVEATGEIVRMGGATGAFTGYHGDPDATANKVRGGLYRSGDLGMIRVIDGRRYLYFAGRTDDWIRKDGENFSSECVSELLRSHPDIDTAVAYGVPSPVGDEWVMAALKLIAGRRFEPQALFEHCERQLSERGGDAKWFPDLVRLVERFETTETHKIRVRDLKADGYDPAKVGAVFIRRRGDRTFRQLDPGEFADVRREFQDAGRLDVFERLQQPVLPARKAI